MIRFQIMLLLVLFLCCSQEMNHQKNESAQHAQDVETVKTIILRGAEFQYQGDIEGYMADRTDDAIWGAPWLRDPMDKQAAFEMYTNTIKTKNWSAIRGPEIKEVILSGDLAVVRMAGATKIVPKDEGEPNAVSYNHWFVLQRQPNGEWKVSHDTWTMTPYDEGE